MSPWNVSLASRALSIPTILVRVLVELVNLVESDHERASKTDVDPSKKQRAVASTTPALHRVLPTTALVARAWTLASQSLLHDELFFDRGTDQLERWLDGVALADARLGGNRRGFVHRRVIFHDPLPFKAGPDGKWDFDVVERVIERLHVCEHLMLGWLGQPSIPTQLLTSPNLRGLKLLVLASPLDTSEGLKPAFSRLTFFNAKNDFPNLARDWTSTFAFLAARPDMMLYHLNLYSLATFSKYLVPALYPLAWSLVELNLPALEVCPSSGSLFVFAQVCTSLQGLSIARVSPASVPSLCLLLVFPPSLRRIRFELVEGSLEGYYDSSDVGARRDVWTHLVDTLDKVAGNDLERIEVGTAKWLFPVHHRRLTEIARDKHVAVAISFSDMTRTPEQLATFTRALQRSLQASLRQIKANQVQTLEVVETVDSGREANEPGAIDVTEAKTAEGQVVTV
ncbi:hypothetical protein JCM10212_000312 [Sporobolomyces blumeae]